MKPSYIERLLTNVGYLEPVKQIEHKPETRSRTQQLRDSLDGQRLWLAGERKRLEKQIAEDTALLDETNTGIHALDRAIESLEVKS